VTTAETQSAAEDLINEKAFDVAIIDLMLEYKDSGFILCYKFKKKNPKAPAIIITGVSAQAGIHFDMSSEESRDWIKADAILDKEIRFEQLDRELGRLLEG
jgi:DNA-binding NtrC family response regulator